MTLLYAMQIDGGPVKIGVSSNVQWRARTIKSKWRVAIADIQHVEVPGNGRVAEQLAHEALSDRALGQELFNVSMDEAKRAIAAVAEVLADGSHPRLQAYGSRKIAHQSQQVPASLKDDLQALADADRRKLGPYIQLVLEAHVDAKKKEGRRK